MKKTWLGVTSHVVKQKMRTAVELASIGLSLQHGGVRTRRFMFDVAMLGLLSASFNSVLLNKQELLLGIVEDKVKSIKIRTIKVNEVETVEVKVDTVLL